jgi:hypothetical protein
MAALQKQFLVRFGALNIPKLSKLVDDINHRACMIAALI